MAKKSSALAVLDELSSIGALAEDDQSKKDGNTPSEGSGPKELSEAAGSVMEALEGLGESLGRAKEAMQAFAAVLQEWAEQPEEPIEEEDDEEV